MIVFKLPDGTSNDIHALITHFWWGQRDSEHRIHWIRQEELICLKVDGGMRFRDLSGFNTMLLAKQLWNLHKIHDSVIGKIMKAKYFKKTSVLEVQLGYIPSFIWRSLSSAQEFLCKASSGELTMESLLVFGVIAGSRTCQGIFSLLLHLI
ncbi:Uncharacterized mitochondrial protein AtMg00310 [Linum grandiflorum]